MDHFFLPRKLSIALSCVNISIMWIYFLNRMSWLTKCKVVMKFHYCCKHFAFTHTSFACIVALLRFWTFNILFCISFFFVRCSTYELMLRETHLNCSGLKKNVHGRHLKKKCICDLNFEELTIAFESDSVLSFKKFCYIHVFGCITTYFFSFRLGSCKYLRFSRLMRF